MSVDHRLLVWPSRGFDPAIDHGVLRVSAVKKERKSNGSVTESQVTNLKPVTLAEDDCPEELISSARIEMLESLSDGISHELNSPLQILSDSFHALNEMNATLQEILEEQLSHLDPEGVEEIEFLKQQAGPAKERVRTGLERIKDVIATFKIFAGQSNEPQREVLELAATLRAALSPFTDSGVPIQLSVRGEASLHALQDDLNSIVGELVSNAISATKARWPNEPKAIKVRAEVVQGVLELEIIDQGIGMSVETQRRIFNPFFSMNADGERRGRGLSVVNQLVRINYQGSISVYSRLEHGATLLVRLPIFK